MKFWDKRFGQKPSPTSTPVETKPAPTPSRTLSQEEFKAMLREAPGQVVVGGTLLLRGVDSGDIELVALMLEKGSDVHAPDSSGVTALHLAAANGQLDIVKLLLANKAHINARTNIDMNGATPLHLAAVRGHAEIARLLLDCRAEVNAQDSNGATSLHLAAFAGQKNVVELLLGHQADITAKDNDGLTPLSQAVHKGHESIAMLLFQHGARA